MNLKQACPRLSTMESLKCFLHPLHIRVGEYVVLLNRKKRGELGVDFNSLLLLGLGSLTVTIRPVLPTLMKCASIRLTLLMAFIFPFIRSLESFFSF